MWILFCRKASVMILQLPLEMHLTTHAQNLRSFKKPSDLKRKYGLQLGTYLALPTAFSVPCEVWDIASQEGCLATLMGGFSVPRFAFSRLGGIGM